MEPHVWPLFSGTLRHLVRRTASSREGWLFVHSQAGPAFAAEGRGASTSPAQQYCLAAIAHIMQHPCAHMSLICIICCVNVLASIAN